MSTTTNFKVHRDLLKLDNIHSKNASIYNLTTEIVSPISSNELADQNYTFLAREIHNVYFTAADSSTARTITLPSAASIVSSISNANVGDVFTFTIDNTHGGTSAGTKTVVLGAGGTSQGSLVVAQDDIAVFDVVLQNVTSGSEAVKVIHNLSSSSSGSTILLADGSAAAPSLAFVNDPDTGIFRNPLLGSGNIDFSSNGSLKLLLTPTQLAYSGGDFINSTGFIEVNKSTGNAEMHIFDTNAGSYKFLYTGTNTANSWTVGQPLTSNGFIIQGLGTSANQILELNAGTANVQVDSNLLLTNNGLAGRGAHLTTNQSAFPIVAPLAAPVTAVTFGGAAATDTAGILVVTTVAGSGLGSGTLTFSQAYTATPSVILTPGTGNWVIPTAAADFTPLRVSASSTTGFTFEFTTTAAGGVVTINYIVIGKQ